MNIEELETMWETDCQIDDNFLGEYATATPKLHAKYIKELVRVKLKHTKYQSDYNLLRKNKFRLYRGELSRDELTSLGWEQWQGVKPLKNEMDEFLQVDPDLIILQDKIEYFKTVMYQLEQIIRSLNSRTWDIKNSIEWTKFTNGLM